MSELTKALFIFALPGSSATVDCASGGADATREPTVKKMATTLENGVFLVLVLAALGCGDKPEDTAVPEGDADTDADGDTDTDADGDTDVMACDTGLDGESPFEADWPTDIDHSDAEIVGGYFIAGLGDTNGDGYDDIMVDGDYTYVLLGPISGFRPEDEGDAALLTGDRPPDGPIYPFPSDGDRAGDLDGDGLQDIVIGRDLDDYVDHTSNYGRVFLSLAPFEGLTYLSEVAAATIIGDGENCYLGSAVAGVGDADGDGIPDILAGARGEDDSRGIAWLIPGTTRGTHTAADIGFAIRGPEEVKWVGAQVAPLGDGDGDGLADFLVSNGEAITTMTHWVGLYRGLVEGDLEGSDATAFLEDEGEEQEFAYGLAGVGDQDGDGLDDFVISVTNDGVAGVFLFPGRIEGRVRPRDAQASLYLGTGNRYVLASSAGDVDGDGWNDVLIGDEWQDLTSGHGDGVAYLVPGPLPQGGRLLQGSQARGELRGLRSPRGHHPRRTG